MAEIASILDSVKKNLGLDSDYTHFDADIITHINSVFFELQQIGIGPNSGFRIEDKTAEWETYPIDDNNKSAVKSYLYLKVRLIFDPPATSFTISAMEKQAQEFLWRLSTNREDSKWTAENP